MPLRLQHYAITIISVSTYLVHINIAFMIVQANNSCKDYLDKQQRGTEPDLEIDQDQQKDEGKADRTAKCW